MIFAGVENTHVNDDAGLSDINRLPPNLGGLET